MLGRVAGYPCAGRDAAITVPRSGRFADLAGIAFGLAARVGDAGAIEAELVVVAAKLACVLAVGGCKKKASKDDVVAVAGAAGSAGASGEGTAGFFDAAGAAGESRSSGAGFAGVLLTGGAAGAAGVSGTESWAGTESGSAGAGVGASGVAGAAGTTESTLGGRGGGSAAGAAAGAAATAGTTQGVAGDTASSGGGTLPGASGGGAIVGEPDYLDEDSDGDTIPDHEEAGDSDVSTPPIDSDADGLPDFVDADSDADGLMAVDEAGDTDPSTPPKDTDGDGVPDYLDQDSDNDHLTDAIERQRGTDPTNQDSDGDTIRDDHDGIWNAEGTGEINALDTDSDDDGILDILEAGDLILETPPVDSDGDGTPDYRDLDSDNDSVQDSDEIDCGLIGHSRISADIDGDGYPDLAERAAAQFQGLEPAEFVCNSEAGMLEAGLEFFFILPFGGEPQQDILRFVPTVKQADVYFNVDTTGSMDGAISNLQSSLRDIITTTQARVTSAAFGANIDILDFATGAVLDTQQAFIIVPPVPPG